MVSMLPSSRHAKDLINHASTHLLLSSDRDLKIALISIYNGVEILLKEHLRYGRNVGEDKVVRIGFRKLVTDSADLQTAKRNKNQLLIFHDIRNEVYHFGMVTPSKEDVDAAMGYAKLLFNEINPQNTFPKPDVRLPSERALERVSKIRTSLELSEMSIMKRIVADLQKHEYETELESMLPNKARVDLIARRKKEIKLYEFKIMSSGKLVRSPAIYQLLAYLKILHGEYPQHKIKGYLVTNAKFNKLVKRTANLEGISLIEL